MLPCLAAAAFEICHSSCSTTDRIFRVSQIIFADKTVKKIFQDGSEESTFPDGTVQHISPEGEKRIFNARGERSD